MLGFQGRSVCAWLNLQIVHCFCIGLTKSQVSSSYVLSSTNDLVDYHSRQNGLSNPKRIRLVAMAEDGCPLGQICFDIQTASSQGNFRDASVNLFLDRCTHGYDFIDNLMRLAFRAIKQGSWLDTTEMVETKHRNKTSNAFYVRAQLTSDSKSSGFDLSADFDYQSLALQLATLNSDDKDSWINAFIPELIREFGTSFRSLDSYTCRLEYQ